MKTLMTSVVVFIKMITSLTVGALAILIFGFVNTADAELVSPDQATATISRSNNDTGGSGAPLYTIDGSGFAGNVIDVAANPLDTDLTVWYF